MKSIGQFRGDEQGSVVLWLAGGMTAVIGMGALAVDVGNFYLQETRLQIAADVAALAAARELNNGEQAVRDAAIEYAGKNLPPAAFGTVLASQDVVVGQWDEDTAAFSSGGASPNAVELTLRRSAGNGNSVNTFFAAVLGFNDMDIAVTTTAMRPTAGGGCFLETGLIAGEKVNFGQDAHVGSGVCVYGRDAVQFGQDPRVDDGAQVGALDINTITFGQDPNIAEGALVEADLEPVLANNISQVLDDLENSVNLPSHITDVVVANNLPSGNLTPGTAYVINNSISIGQDRTYSDVIIATRESISFGQDGAVRNSAGGCPSGETAIGLYAVKNISIGQDGRAEGVQMVAGETITIGQDLKGLKASIQAGKDIIIGQDPGFSGCGGAIDSGSGNAMATARLVR